jgi:ribonuclease PH
MAITLDCDCLVADGGTRTASISGAYIALELAVKKLLEQRVINEYPLTGRLAAISVGIFAGEIIADLSYAEDSNCSTDMNLVMTHDSKLVEIQGTAESHPFDLETLHGLIECGMTSLQDVIAAQMKVL